MSENNESMPHFVRKQVELAMAELAQAVPERHYHWKGQGNRWVIFSATPHPTVQGELRLPVALLRHQQDEWHLFFRGSHGDWVAVPNGRGRLHEVIAIIKANPDSVF